MAREHLSLARLLRISQQKRRHPAPLFFLYPSRYPCTEGRVTLVHWPYALSYFGQRVKNATVQNFQIERNVLKYNFYINYMVSKTKRKIP